MTLSIETNGTSANSAPRSSGGAVNETDEVRYAIANGSLGRVLVARTEQGVCAILLGDQAEPDLKARMARAGISGGDALCGDYASRVISFIDDPSVGLDLPLDVRGTPFQKRVWKALRAISIGKTVSYSELARRLGAPEATRAVASACGANPIALAVPCHRVVAKDGSLGGYRWGVERKRTLLEKERQS
jgi:AraC family transcriptional regulator of adaptative response/methylated-DNA-[protein]-cysteine methyltransferase